jgi:hypothetical protein
MGIKEFYIGEIPKFMKKFNLLIAEPVLLPLRRCFGPGKKRRYQLVLQ